MRRLGGIAILIALTLPPGAPRGQTAADPDAAIIGELVVANRILAAQGVLEGFGHISARSKRNPEHYYLAVAKAPGLVTARDIVEFDADSRPVKADQRSLYSERFIHGEIYRVRRDVQSVVHSHSVAVLPFTITRAPLKAAIHTAYFLGTEPAPVFEIRDTAGDDNNMLVRDIGSGAALARVLDQRSVALMRGHGMAVVAPAVREAVFRAYYTQVNAQVSMEAFKLGEPTFLNRFEVRRSEMIDRQWESWRSALPPARN